MAKPPDKANTTQPLSDSQVLKVSQQKSPGVSKNDQSVWKGLVVPAGEFAPAQPKRGSRTRTWAIVGVLGGGGVAGGALYAAGVLGHGSSEPAAAAPQAQAQAQAPLPPQDAVPPDAAVVPSDAGVAAAPLDADAVSSAALPTKATKALATKKKRPALPKKRAH
jgi:hypothetical protein